MPTYRIADWDRRFETTRSRAMTNCRFVSVPLMLADRGYMRLMRKADGAACFGVYVALAVWQMGRFDGRTRDGWLTDDGTADGLPLSADDLAVELRMDELTVSVAMDELSAPEIGMLEAHAGAGEGREVERGTIGGETEGGTEGRTERKREGREVAAGAGARVGAAPSSRLTPDRTDGRTALPHPPACAGTGLRPADAGTACGPSDDREAPRASSAGRADREDGEAEDGRTTDGRTTDRRTTDDGQREAGVSAPLNAGGVSEQQQPPASPLFASLAVLEVPCQDGVWEPSPSLLTRWLNAYPDVNVQALVLRMAAWNYSKLEAGGQEFYRAWKVESAPGCATQWLAEEQQKFEQRKARGEDAEEARDRRGAAGAPDGDWRREIESLDKLARGKRRRMKDLDAKYHFFDDTESRERWPTAWGEYCALQKDEKALVVEMSKVKRGGAEKKGGGR